MGNFDSIECQNLYHKCIPLTVPRFYFFVEDLVVGCNDITELGRAGYVAFEIEYARNSCNVRSLANLAIWIFGKVRKMVRPFGFVGRKRVRGGSGGSSLAFPEDVDR